MRGGSNASFLAEDAAARETRRLACEEIRHSPIGAVARSQGWLVALVQFVIDQRRLPELFEVPTLREQVHKAIAAAMDVSHAALRESLLRFNLAREESAEREIFGVIKHD